MSDIRKPSRTLTDNEKIEIKNMLKEGHFQNRIAAKYDVNPGRISEIKTGKIPTPRYYQEDMF